MITDILTHTKKRLRITISGVWAVSVGMIKILDLNTLGIKTLIVSVTDLCEELLNLFKEWSHIM